MTETDLQPKLKSNEKLSSSSYQDHLTKIIGKQRTYFKSGATKSISFRINQLKKLRKLIANNEKRLAKALQEDLNREIFFSTFTIGGILTEIDYALERVLTLRPPFITRRVSKWSKPKKVGSPILFLGGKTINQNVPKGLVLIIGPWNYPLLLLIVPLVGAIAGGNCCVIKPSEMAPNSSKVLADILNSTFETKYLHVEEGGIEESITLTNQKEWDHIFFTGSTSVGKKVYQAAAKNLIPVTLELGGKTPTIVDKDADLEITAKRIAQMKFINAGQTCMAPDYLLVHREIRELFVKRLKHYIDQFFTEDPLATGIFSKIIDEKNFKRLTPYLEISSEIKLGGKSDSKSITIEPTILDNVTFDSEIMKEEIFGPILPVLTYDTIQEVTDYIEGNPHPLALYIYSKDKKFIKQVHDKTSFGGGMVNDSVLYALHPNIPFGGIGNSGMGNYTGKFSFDTFTQSRPIIYSGGIIDTLSEKLKIKFFRYPPGSRLKLFLLKLFQRSLSRFRIF